MAANSGSDSQPCTARPAWRSESARLAMSPRSTSAAPVTPRPAALMARAAARRSSAREMVVRWVPAPRRTWSSSVRYCVVGPPAVVAAVGLVPFDLAGGGVGHCGLEHLNCGAGAGLGERGVHPSPPADPLGPVVAVEQHERRVGNGDDGGEGLAVRVVDHHRARRLGRGGAAGRRRLRAAPGSRRAGAEADALARYWSWPAALRAPNPTAVPAHSTAGRPPTRTKAVAASGAQATAERRRPDAVVEIMPATAMARGEGQGNNTGRREAEDQASGGAAPEADLHLTGRHWLRLLATRCRDLVAETGRLADRSAAPVSRAGRWLRRRPAAQGAAISPESWPWTRAGGCHAGATEVVLAEAGAR